MKQAKAGAGAPGARRRRRDEFPEEVLAGAWKRQQGLCAMCGTPLLTLLEETEFDVQAHHVLPEHLGGPATEDNCVHLCSGGSRSDDPEFDGTTRDRCHYRAHADGRYGQGYVAPPNLYPYSHGGLRDAHAAWVRRMNPLFRLPVRAS